MKGTAKAATNIKPMAGGAAIAQLPVGGWVYGEVGATDITGFTHWYKPDGTKVELGQACKAWKANLTLVDESEPTEENPPVEEPVDLTLFDFIRQTREGTPTASGGVTWGEWKYEGVVKLEELL